MQNFRMISLIVSEIDAFEETYRGVILCIFLRARDFSQILDGCKFRTVKDRNFQFPWNAQLLVRCSAHRKENTWLCIMAGVRMPWKRQKFVSLRTPDFGILFCAFRFILELWFSTNNKPCTNTPYNCRKVWHSCFRYILIGL